MKFPEHKCGLFLQHNEHRDYYQSVPEWLSENKQFAWRDEASKLRAIESDVS